MPSSRQKTLPRLVSLTRRTPTASSTSPSSSGMMRGRAAGMADGSARDVRTGLLPPLRSLRGTFSMNERSIKPRFLVSPRTALQYEALRADAQERLERAALTVFARAGYARATVRDVAVEAGVAQGLLYNYYVGKQDLLVAVFRRS